MISSVLKIASMWLHCALFILLSSTKLFASPQEVNFTTVPNVLVAGETHDITLKAAGDMDAGDYVDWRLGGAKLFEGAWTPPQLDEPLEPGYVEVLSNQTEVSIPNTTGADLRVRVKTLVNRDDKNPLRIRIRGERIGETAHLRSLEARHVRPGGAGVLSSDSLAAVAAAADKLHIIVPTLLEVGSDVRIRVASMDEFSNAAPILLQDVPFEILNLETGAAFGFDVFDLDSNGKADFQYPGLSPGAYQMQTQASASLQGTSNPFLVLDTNFPFTPVYWGDPQVHGEFSQDALTITWTELAKYVRDTVYLDWFAATDHDFHLNDAPNSLDLAKAAILAEQNNDMVPFIGFEWTSEGPANNLTKEAHMHSWGHREILFKDPNEAVLLSSTDPQYEDLVPFLQSMDTLAPSGFIAIPHFLGAAAYRQFYEGGPWWEALPGITQQELERLTSVVEIYNDLGSGETNLFGDNWRISKLDHEMEIVNRGLSTRRFRDACAAGRAFGVVGASDGHFGRIGTREAGRFQPMGLTAVFAAERTRDAIFGGLQSKRCYATSSVRIAIVAALDGMRIGTSLQASGTMELQFLVAGTAPIDRVVLVIDGVDGPSWSPVGGTEQALSIETDLTAADGVYYLRVEQKPDALAPDGERAWTSPWLVGSPSPQ